MHNSVELESVLTIWLYCSYEHFPQSHSKSALFPFLFLLPVYKTASAQWGLPWQQLFSQLWALTVQITAQLSMLYVAFGQNDHRFLKRKIRESGSENETLQLNQSSSLSERLGLVSWPSCVCVRMTLIGKAKPSARLCQFNFIPDEKGFLNLSTPEDSQKTVGILQRDLNRRNRRKLDLGFIVSPSVSHTPRFPHKLMMLINCRQEAGKLSRLSLNVLTQMRASTVLSFMWMCWQLSWLQWLWVTLCVTEMF